MSAHRAVRCPHCDARLKLSSTREFGKNLPCPNCGKSFSLKSLPKVTKAELPISTAPCPHCKVKLKIPKNMVEGKRFACPKCNAGIVLKSTELQAVRAPAVQAAEAAADATRAAISHSDTDPGTNGLAQTQSQLSESKKSSQRSATSGDIILDDGAGDLVPLDEESEVQSRPRRDSDTREDDDDGGLYRLCTGRKKSPKPFRFDTEQVDEEDATSDESDVEVDNQHRTVVEATSEELDLMEALEGLAKQARSQPARRRRKTNPNSTRKRTRR